MIRRPRGVFALLATTAALMLAACANATSQSGPETLALRAGEEQPLAGRKVFLLMVRLVEDSRCPANAQCVWAGNAAISLRVHTPSGMAMTYQLNTNADPKTVVAMGYDIRLDSLLKAPALQAPHAPEYVAYVTATPAQP